MDQRIDLMIEKGGQALSPKLKKLREKAYQALSYWLEQGCDFERDIIPAIVDRSYGQPPAKAGGWGLLRCRCCRGQSHAQKRPMPVVTARDAWANVCSNTPLSQTSSSPHGCLSRSKSTAKPTSGWTREFQLEKLKRAA